MGVKLTPDTRTNAFVMFDDDGVILGGFENGADIDAVRCLEVVVENQEKNISLARLIAEPITLTRWEMKNDKVNIVVKGKDKRATETLLADLSVTING